MSADSIFDFTDNLSGALGGPTTGLPPVTSAGHAGFLLGTGLNELSNNLDSKSTSDSFHDSNSDSWWNQ